MYYPHPPLPTFSFPTEGWHQIAISAKGKLHIAELQQLLTEVSSIPTLHQSDIIVTNARHFEALTHALEAIHRVQEGLNSSLSGDFISQDLRGVYIPFIGYRRRGYDGSGVAEYISVFLHRKMMACKQP